LRAGKAIEVSHMNEFLDHLDSVSVFGRSAAALFLVLIVNFAITALHSYQELLGRGGPLWRNFGAIVGVYVPNGLGFVLFTAGLVLALWALALAGIAGWLPFVGFVGPSVSAAALGALIGARLSDTAISHVALHAAGYRPNPGLSSTLLYVVEAVFMLIAFQKGLAGDPTATMCGFLAGALVFVLVLPLLWLARLAIPAWRRTRWSRWQPLPAWATETST
jgi:hypothetical protein